MIVTILVVGLLSVATRTVGATPTGTDTTQVSANADALVIAVAPNGTCQYTVLNGGVKERSSGTVSRAPRPTSRRSRR